MLKQPKHTFIGRYTPYRDYLSIIQRAKLIAKQKELYKKEKECYEQAFKNNPSHKLVYNNEFHHL